MIFYTTTHSHDITQHYYCLNMICIIDLYIKPADNLV